MVLNTFLLTLTGLAASYWQSWWPVMPCIAIMVGMWLFLVHLRPMAVVAPVRQSQLGKMAILEGMAVVATVINP